MLKRNGIETLGVFYARLSWLVN